MDPTSIFLGVLNSFGQHSTNRQNMAIADRQNRANQKMQEQQNAFNLRMWHAQNAYNDPSEQRKRFERAGLNPALMLGQFSAGQAESLTSAQGHPSVGAQMQNPLAGAVDAYVAGTNAELTKNQAELVRSQTEAQDIENYWKDLKFAEDSAERASRIRNLDRQTAYVGAMTDGQLLKNITDERLQEKVIEEATERINKLKSDIDIAKIQKDILDFEKSLNPLKVQEYALRLAHIKATISYVFAQSSLSYAQKEKIVQETLTEEFNTSIAKGQDKKLRTELYNYGYRLILEEKTMEDNRKAIQARTRRDEKETETIDAREVRENVKVLLQAGQLATEFMPTTSIVRNVVKGIKGGRVSETSTRTGKW